MNERQPQICLCDGVIDLHALAAAVSRAQMTGQDTLIEVDGQAVARIAPVKEDDR